MQLWFQKICARYSIAIHVKEGRHGLEQKQIYHQLPQTSLPGGYIHQVALQKQIDR